MPDGLSFRAEAVTVRGAGGVLVADLSLRASGGEVVAITGPSGSGKTSLLHVLGGLAAPASGELTLSGTPVSLWQDAALGLVLQNPHLLTTLTAHETVALPMQARGLARADVALRTTRTLTAVGLADHGGQLVGELSGGQRQRVAVAQALAGEPDVILADEPTSALDPYWRAMVLDQLRAAAHRGAIVIIASSDPEVVERCDQTVSLG